MARKISFKLACAQYPHRFTMEHIPAWARKPFYNASIGCHVYYAPQYRTDLEWYENTLFQGESCLASADHCLSGNASWPLGEGFLREPFHLNKNQKVIAA